ncbi:oxidoreductase ucpA [Trichodelitschia bisporula]|uniref:Oxidoreductase ucpA n=1 Tax=Trichodelitschia bisporula TaxID=703511 RepID=A0A6G1I1Q7_9PEZI|nr:oxidoreductase ucpA [Trichodelitschia bisporula]
MSTGRLTNKVTIVTGAGTGFGAGIAAKFASEGARVLVWDIDSASASAVASSLPNALGLAFEGDVTKPADWSRALETCVQKWGSVDVLVNNAGIVYPAMSSLDVEEKVVDRLWDVNVKPLYHSAKVLVPYWKERGGGGIVVNISSISAPRPRPNLVWYAASKGAVTATTRGLAAEMAPFGIRYNCIQPVIAETNMLTVIQGGTDTPEGRAALSANIPAGRMARPADVANAACYLASEEASFLTGVCLDVDGGRSLA